MDNTKTITLSLRLPANLIERVDKHAAAETRTRVNMVQVLLQEALAARESKGKQ